MTKKFVALSMVLVLVVGVGALAEAEEPVSLQITSVGLSSNFFGEYQEVGSVYGLSGGVNFEDFLIIRGVLARGPQRVPVDNSWVRFAQHDRLTELMFLGDVNLQKTCTTQVELRPGFVFGNKTIVTRIDEKWYDRVNFERWSKPFWGPVLELGFERGQMTSYLGVQAVNHESCCREEWDGILYGGFGIDF